MQLISTFTAALVIVLGLSLPANAIGMCGSGKRVTCVVDGDTIWLKGEKIRLQGFDTPETTTNLCGGAAEKALGKKAARRLMQLLNENKVTIQRTGRDRYGRTLAIFRIDGRDIGDILVAEQLARYWPDGREFWCN